MGWFSKEGKKQGTFVEGEKSKSHTHRSGKKGSDVEAYKKTYKDDEVVSKEKSPEWGKIHNDD